MSVYKSIYWKFQTAFRKELLKLGMRLARKAAPPSPLDSEEPRSFLKYPNTQFALPGGAAATQVTPEANLWSGFAEFFVVAGNPPAAVDWRKRTFVDGWIPIVQASKIIDGIDYKLEMFMERLGDDESGPIAHFVQIETHNTSKESRNAAVGMGMTYPPVSHRCHWKWFVEEKFSKAWRYKMQDASAYRGGKMMFALCDGKFTNRFEKTGKRYSGEFKKVKRGEACCTGVVDFRLDAGEIKCVRFAIPYRPIAENDENAFSASAADYSKFRERAIRRWKGLMNPGAELIVPERKVFETSQASRMYNFQSRVKKGEQWVQLVNRLHYAHFWLRDAAFISRMWDVWGYHDVAEETLLNFLEYAKPNGFFCSQSGQLDGHGQSLWAFGKHVRMTNDKAFGNTVYPYVKRGVAWLDMTLAGDAYGLLPPSDALDNELIKGRYTGHNIWALAGLREAIFLAEFLDKKNDAAGWRRLFDDYKSRFINRLREVAAHNEGIAPPGLDVRGGEHWGNLLLLYVGELFDPGDLIVTATFEHYRKNCFAEGLATWNKFLHHYMTERVAQTALIRREPERAVHDFYSMLAHTGPTHEGFEWTIPPRGGRDYAIPVGPFELANFPPHGWFAACYNLLLRNMILMEGVGGSADTLFVFSGLSPAWAKPGSEIGLRNAPTHFGEVDVSLIANEDSAVVKFSPKWRKAPAKVVMPKPYFVERWSLKGQMADTADDLIFPISGGKIEIVWKIDPEKSAMSYESVWDDLKREYEGR